MAALVDNWYEQRKGEPFYSVGAICVAPSPYLIENLVAIRCDHYDPVNPSASYFSLKPIRTAAMGKAPTHFHHPPMHGIGLRLDEELLAVKAKLRPVVILSVGLDLRSGNLGALVGERVAECFVCAPIYSLYQKDGTPKFKVEFIDRLRRLEWPYFFPLPACGKFGREDSFLRFDRLSVVAKSNLDGTRTWLSTDAMVLVQSWLSYYLSGDMDELMAELRQELAATGPGK